MSEPISCTRGQERRGATGHDRPRACPERTARGRSVETSLARGRADGGRGTAHGLRHGSKTMNVRQILVPIDGSEVSLAAADTAAELAQRLGASITLLTVVEPPEAISDYVSKTA